RLVHDRHGAELGVGEVVIGAVLGVGVVDVGHAPGPVAAVQTPHDRVVEVARATRLPADSLLDAQQPLRDGLRVLYPNGGTAVIVAAEKSHGRFVLFAYT